jgi:hypothetical protein
MRTSLLATLAATLIAGAALAAPQPIPNSVKYSDTGVPNAKGRSGTATIEARALINQDGSADLEVTTGDFAGGPRGTLEKVQVKLSTDPGTRNFTGLDSPTFTLHLDDFVARHDALQVQTNVRGVDGSRTDVVTVSETAKLRPDLVAATLDAPARAVPGLPTLILATVQERNGDTGARASCVLYVDGAEADRAEQIWVDAGDTVTCQFEHTFEDVGQRQLEVVLRDVTPGDWDDTNNRVAGALLVINPSEGMTPWTVNAREEEYERHRKTKSPFEESTTDETGWVRSLHFSALVKQADIDFNSMHVGIIETSDGTVLADYPDMELIADNPPRDANDRHMKEWNGGRVIVVAYNRGFHPDFPFYKGPIDFFSMQVNHVSTRISYHSAGRTKRSPHVGPDGWYYFDNGYEQGTQIGPHYGSSVDLNVLVYDANRTKEADAHIVLTPYETNINKPYSCRAGGTICSSEFDRTIGKSGSDSQDWNF